MSPDKTDKARLFIRFGIVLIFLSSIFYLFSGGFNTNFQSEFVYAALLIQPVVIASLILMAWRTTILGANKLDFWVSFKAIILVSAFLLVLPSRLSDLIKPVYLFDRRDFPISQGMALLLVERVMDLLIVLFLFLIALLLFSNQYMPQLGNTIVSLVTIFILVMTIIILFVSGKKVIETILQKLPFPVIHKIFRNFIKSLETIADKKRMMSAMFLSVPVWISSYLIFFCYFKAIGASDVTATNTLLIFLAGTAGLVVTVAPGGIGTFETAIAISMQLYGFSFSDGLLHGFMIRVAILLPNIIAMAALFFMEDFKITSLFKKLQKTIKELSD